MPLKQSVAVECKGQWITSFFQTQCEQPSACLYGAACPCCAVYQQRVRLLEITGEPYICFGGLFPVGPLRNPQGRSWLAIEVAFCPCWALSSNRYIVQTRFDKANTLCDSTLLAATGPCKCCADAARSVFCKDTPELGDCTCFAIVPLAGCMHAQQQVEIDEIKQHGYFGPADTIFEVLPPMQQEMIQLGKPMGAGQDAGDEVIGADGVIPAPESKTKFEAPMSASKGNPKHDARAPLFGLCDTWLWPCKSNGKTVM